MKIFISGVTSEFGEVRDALASDLRARGHTVHVQSDFQQKPENETLLGTLAAYIGECGAVICIVGRYCGACPPQQAVSHFANVLPNGARNASYTQWEFFLARHSKLRLYIYTPGDDYRPDRYPAIGDRADLQRAFVDYLKEEGVHYTTFSTADELRIAVLRDAPEIADPPRPDRLASKPIVLPYPSIGDLFKGRDNFMQRLHDSLTRARGVRTAIVSQALYGLGGIGKTRAAVEYAWAHTDDYNALLFVVAETPEALRRNLAALASTLVPQLEITDEAARLAAVLDWLKCNPGWFLILDNVDTRPVLAEVEGLVSGLIGGYVIITSRLADFPGHIQTVELDVLSVKDAAKFLLLRTEGKRRPALDDEAKAREVAQELGGLALALEQAGAFIVKRRLTFAQYLEQWLSNREEVLAWFDPVVIRYPRAVAITWQTSVGQLSESGRRFLECLAWLAPEKVPESMLDVPMTTMEIENLRVAYEDLAAYSLVTLDAEGPYFLVHRLIQDVTRRSLTGELRRHSLVEALNWVNAAFKGDPGDVRSWSTLDLLIPHARIVTIYADADGVAEPTARLMNQLGLLFDTKALHVDAEPLFRRALAIYEVSRGLDDPNVGVMLGNLSRLLRNTNRLAEAEPLMRRALAISEKAYGTDHPNAVRALNNLAGLLRATSRLTEAEPLYRRALSIVEKSLEAEDTDFATTLNNLAQLLKDTNRVAEAEPLMRRALTIDERSFGPDHPNVGIRLNNLALLLQGTKRLDEAEPLMRRALAIDEKSYGSDHPNVATNLNNLAQLLEATKRLSEAEPLMRRALAIDEKSYGPDHPNVATDLNNLAQLLGDTKRLSEAEPLMRRALAIDEMSYGPDHPDVATDLSNLAQLLQTTKRLSEAEPLMRRAVAIAVKFTAETGYRHPRLDARLKIYRSILAELRQSQSQIDAACAELLQPISR